MTCTLCPGIIERCGELSAQSAKSISYAALQECFKANVDTCFEGKSQHFQLQRENSIRHDFISSLLRKLHTLSCKF